MMETEEWRSHIKRKQVRPDSSGIQRKVRVLRHDDYTKNMLLNEEPALYVYNKLWSTNMYLLAICQLLLSALLTKMFAFLIFFIYVF